MVGFCCCIISKLVCFVLPMLQAGRPLIHKTSRLEDDLSTSESAQASETCYHWAQKDSVLRIPLTYIGPAVLCSHQAAGLPPLDDPQSSSLSHAIVPGLQLFNVIVFPQEDPSIFALLSQRLEVELAYVSLPIL